MSVFDQFTNKYSLSKTLRFELKPVGKTQEMLKENNVFDIDRAIREKYIKTKPFFDRLHREFIQAGLEGFVFSDLREYEAALKKFMDDRKNKTLRNTVEDKEGVLRREVVIALNAQAKKWATEKYTGLKNKNIGFLSEEGVFENVLLPRYGRNDDGTYNEDTIEVISRTDQKTGEVIEETISIFEGWKGFIGYFKKFFETRANFYKADGTATAIATRITDNLRRCFENRWLLEKYPKEFLETLPEKYCDMIKNAGNFGDFVLQGKKGSGSDLGTGIDGYNQVVGHIKKEANLFKQRKKIKIQHLKTLDKQILSPKEKFIDEIDNEEQLKKELTELLQTGNASVAVLRKLFEDFAHHNSDFDLTRIYFTKKGFETLSRKYSVDIRLWEEQLFEVFKENKDKSARYDKKQERYTFPNHIKVAYVQASLEKITAGFDGTAVFWKEKYHQERTTADNVWQQFLHILLQEFSELLAKTGNGEVQGYKIFAQKLDEELRKDELKKTKELTATVKLFADNLLSIYQFAKYFSLEYKNRWNVDFLETDDAFYEKYYNDFFAEAYEKIVQPYNRLRNYLTKKPWEEVQKWKLNFENPTLANGWDKNKESDNTAVILRKNGNYFLGVMKKSGGANKMFDDKHKNKFEGEGYEKMDYKLLPGASKMLPKVFFSKSNIAFYAPNEEVLRIRNHATHTKNGTAQKGYIKQDFSLDDCHKVIDFYKTSLQKHPDWQKFNFTFLPTKDYKDISGFYRDVENGGYKISWQNVSEQYIDEKNQSGDLYLFHIKNRDWNIGKKRSGTKNVHTMYFENVFSKANALHNFIFKLNGEAELFYRPKSIARVEEKRNFTRGIIAKKRYTEDKSFFHVPITINRTAGEKTPFQFNQEVNAFLAKNPHINILGIDRGEKHLVYYSLINQKGKILESNSLNVINGKDYHWELEKRAKNREQQRRDWEKVDEIKDLKKGYISHVVHKIAKLAIENNAIIVFEDLNMRFKQVRGGIEKSTYQQLEKALLDKLNFCVDKTKEPAEVGGVLNAHQLTAPVKTFKEMGKQTGMIFYTTAAYTSQIDPVSGWRPHLYLRYENAKLTSKMLKEKLDAIEWSDENQRFDFVYTYEGRQWRVCSNVERWKGYRNQESNNQWEYKKFPAAGDGSITKNLRKLFIAEKIDISQNIISQINENSSKDLLEGIVFYFRLICQIRNTDGNLHKEIRTLKESGNFDCQDQKTAQKISDEDFILSPVEPFFDSRKAEQFDKNLPKNGDANGAYNIARKGVLILERINTWSKSEKRDKTNPDLFIKNEEWDAFIVENCTRR